MRPLALSTRYRKKVIIGKAEVHTHRPSPTTTMPKSKRAKVVHLTKVNKKGKELSLKLFANVRECLDQYQYCFVFSVENMRNTYLKDVRTELGDSRFVSLLSSVGG